MATVTYKKGKLYDLPIIGLKPDPHHDSIWRKE